MNNVQVNPPKMPGKDVDSAPSEMPIVTEIDTINELTPMELDTLKYFRKHGLISGNENHQILLKEFRQTLKNLKPVNNRKEKYNQNTIVAKWLDDQAEDLHKKLKLNKIQEE